MTTQTPNAPALPVAEREPWVVDASMGVRGGLFAMCPVELGPDGEISSITYGLTYLGAKVPDHARIVAIVHDDGNEAVEAFYAEHETALAALARTGEAE